ncbi:DNA polymerase III subunit gamma/tau [Microbacterium sp. CCNWLW134]|uniref:DNA polymerase III subunit gamma/tau n=1 Tax=Microbacterium sp. CCNWLW134 TaxID=3122064 RepID=UPI0030105FEF
MSRDEDAFRWEGDDDPAPVDPPAATAGAATALPPGYRAVGKGSDGLPPETPLETAPDTPARVPVDDEPAEDTAPGGMGNASLIALGILGGVYLLFSIGWLIGGLRVHGIASFLVSGDGVAPPVWTTGNAAAVGLAVAAPALWFTAVYTLTRRSASWLRWVLLAAGVVLLIPWPFIVVGAFGS